MNLFESNDQKPLTTQSVKEALEVRDYVLLRRYFRDNELADIAEIFSDLEVIHSIVMFRMVPRPRRAPLFSYL